MARRVAKSVQLWLLQRGLDLTCWSISVSAFQPEKQRENKKKHKMEVTRGAVLHILQRSEMNHCLNIKAADIFICLFHTAVKSCC